MKRYPEYKDSEIDWIPCLPKHWETVSMRKLLKERIELNKPEKTRELLALSYALGVTLYRDKKYNMDRVKEDFTQYKIVHENDFVLSPNDIIKGSAYVSKYYGCISPMYLIFESRSRDLTELNFLSYFVRSQVAGRKFFSLAKGLIGSILDNGKYVTRRMTVSRNDILSFKIALPPHDEQEAIVEFLETKTSKIDAYVAEREREIAALEELKQAEIASVVTRGLNPDTKLKQSGIFWVPLIPQNWQVHKLKYILSKLNREREPNSELLICSNKGEVYPRGNAKLGLVSDSEEIYQGVKPGDLLIHGMDTWHGAIGISSFDGMCTPVVHVCESNQNKKYIYYYLRFMAFMKVFKLISNGVRQNTSDFRSWDKVGSILAPIPPIEEQNAIVEYIEQKTAKIDGLIADLTEQIEKLKEYKQRLIADAVTGQIDVRPNN